MRKFLKAAVIAVPVALAAYAPTQAQATPMVAAGWVVAVGVGGLVLGFLANNALANNRQFVVTPAHAQPISYGAGYYGCETVRVKYQGRWRQAQICD